MKYEDTRVTLYSLRSEELGKAQELTKELEAAIIHTRQIAERIRHHEKQAEELGIAAEVLKTLDRQEQEMWNRFAKINHLPQPKWAQVNNRLEEQMKVFQQLNAEKQADTDSG